MFCIAKLRESWRSSCKKRRHRAVFPYISPSGGYYGGGHHGGSHHGGGFHGGGFHGGGGHGGGGHGH